MYKKRCLGRQNSCFSSVFSKVSCGKKGQITIFIILGLLLLLIFILIIAFKQEVLVFQSDEVLPTEKSKITRLITTCIDKVGDDAMFKIGLQGGYIEVPDYISRSVNRNVRISPMNVVPYWAYGETKEVPTLQEIKHRIDKYIEENLRECLFNLDPFKSSYDLAERSELSVNTEIVESKVLFNVKWNLEISTKDGSLVAELNEYVTESPVKLKRVYEMATTILDKEMIELKLEDLTQDLIALEHPKVPLTGFEMACSKKRWKVSEVEEELKRLIQVNIQKLKIEKTNYINFPEELPYYKNHYIWDLGEEVINPEISVFFDYQQNFPFAYSVRPNKGGYLTSSQIEIGEMFSILCMQNWKFVYDVTYPVVVNVRDDTTGYNFKMAFTVHLKNNYPDRKGVKMPMSEFSLVSYDDAEFCKNKKIDMIVQTFELIENPDNGVYSREPLENVDVDFTCVRYNCPIGKTEYDFAGMGHIAAYRTNFPYCVGGIVKGNKEGFKEGWDRVVTEDGKEISVDLIPEISIPLPQIKVVKHKLLTILDEGGNEQKIIGEAEELINNDQVSLGIKFNKDGAKVLEGEKFHESIIYFSGDLDKKVQDEQKLILLAKADFSYDLNIDVVKEGRITGGNKGKWQVSWDDLSEAQGIIFHVLVDENLAEEEMYDFVTNLNENSVLLPLPEIIK